MTARTNKTDFRLIALIFLAFVVVVSGCVSNTEDSVEDTDYTYSELENISQTISHNNLLQYPDGHRGKMIREHGKIFQVLDGGFLVASRAIYTGRSYEYMADPVWVSTSDKSSLIEKDQIVTVFGEYQGTKTYETNEGEFETVPQMKMEYITDKVEVTVRADTYGGENIPDKVDKLCADGKCVENVANATFRLAINEEHNFWVEDEDFREVNETKRISSKTSFPLGVKIKENY